MQHIVIDAREYSSSTGRYIRNLLSQLEKLDRLHRYTVLLQPKDFKHYQPKAANFAKKPAPFKEFSFAEQLGFNTFIKNLQPDLVHFGMTHQPVLYRGPVITTIHDLTITRFRNPATAWPVFKAKQLVYRGVIWRVAHASKQIITPSQFVKDDLVQTTRIKPSKVMVTYEAAQPITEAATTLPALTGKRFLVYVGRAQPHKNLKRLIEAFEILKHHQSDLHLVLVGKIDLAHEQLLDYARRRGIKDIELTGFVSQGQLRWLYEHCQAYVFPSLSEGFGLPALEAMAQGAPVVSSQASCLPEIYQDGALYFDPFDTVAMAEQINEVLTNQPLRHALITQGKLVAKSYSWQRMAQQTLQVYQQVLKKI